VSAPFPRPSTGTPRPSFAVHVDLVAGSVRLDGVLSRRTVHLFSDAVRTLQAADRPEWVIDVAGLERCDAAGLRALGIAYRRALVRGRRVVVHAPPPWLCRALARIRLDSHVLVDPQERG
jgi:anti-anti-sigma regulatory factor